MLDYDIASEVYTYPACEWGCVSIIMLISLVHIRVCVCICVWLQHQEGWMWMLRREFTKHLELLEHSARLYSWTETWQLKPSAKSTRLVVTGFLETAADKVAKRRLEWLSHLARMPNHCIPKQMLFGWLPQPRPRCGLRKRWRKVIHKDLKDIEVDEGEWYEEATTCRATWRATYCSGIAHHQQARSHTHTNQFECQQCSRKFRRER